MNLLLDTNIIMNYPEIFDKWDNKDNLYVSTYTLDELDYKKESRDGETAFKARRASRTLFSKYGKYIWEKDTVADDMSNAKVDMKLLILSKTHGYTLLTSDVNMGLYAQLLDIPYVLVDNNSHRYTGMAYYTTPLDDKGYNAELEDMLERGTVPEGLSLKENQFLIVKDKDGNRLANFRYNLGKLSVVKGKYIKNKYVGSIAPRNPEQECLFSLLFDKKISILATTGEYGTGKTWITLNYALQELDAGRINKIVFVPNNSFVENAREHGFEPGDAIDKELAFLGTIIDIIGEDRVRRAIEVGEIEVVPLAVMRGRNFENAIVLVNEAENINSTMAQLLIGRIGENSRIIFDGDEKQADSQFFRNNSGLSHIAKLADSEEFAPIYGMVKMVTVERSFTAQAAAYLDNL